MKYQGTVTYQQFGSGSKSEHQAVVLLTTTGPLKLRRAGGNPFRDPELEKLVGREIVCDGQLHGEQLLMTRWNLVAATKN
jgi:hypothetical protein